MDTVKLWLAGILLAAAVGAFYYLVDQSLLLRVLGLLAVLGVSVAIALTTEWGQGLWGFLQDARNELRKVDWPSRAETVQTSLAVFAMVALVGLMLWLFDMFLFWAVRLLTGQGG
jgi:preprotein translocase subunit SecE